MTTKSAITVARGDGIGPEIMDAVLLVLREGGAELDIEEIEIGEKVYKQGIRTGIEDSAWESLRRTRVFLKAPITTPQGSGVKSLNVTTRKMLGLFANVRPCVAYHPMVSTKHPNMDVVVVRENEEDLYAGIEHQQTPEVAQTLKLMSRPGCERITRFAFDYAVMNKRKKVTCFTKDNIMKITDGMFHRIFDEIAVEYPDIENEHWIVDIGCAKLADTPEQFDVIVMPNLYGDILSDMAAQIAGSVGLAGAANIGVEYAMFEAIHGSAPRRAGQNLANPSGLLISAVMMLAHIHQPHVADLIHNAWLRTLDDGIHTYDIYKQDISTQQVGTREFAAAVIERLGKKPQHLKPVSYRDWRHQNVAYKYTARPAVKKEVVGVDVFIYDPNCTPNELGATMTRANTDKLKVTVISNLGSKVWPDGFGSAVYRSDQWRCRFYGRNISHRDIIELLQRITDMNEDFVKTEQLMEFGGTRAYSLEQGEL